MRQFHHQRDRRPAARHRPRLRYGREPRNIKYMARDCRSTGVVAALLRIADRYEALAIQREQEDRGG
jgi:hypothetical protein